MGLAVPSLHYVTAYDIIIVNSVDELKKRMAVTQKKMQSDMFRLRLYVQAHQYKNKRQNY